MDFDESIKELAFNEGTIMDFDDVLKRVKENPDIDFDFFIIFKDEDNDYARTCCTGNTRFTVEFEHVEITFDGNGVCLNPKRCLQDPVELLENLRDHIDYIFA